MARTDPPRLDEVVDQYFANAPPGKRRDLKSLNCVLRRLNAPWITTALAGSDKCTVEVAGHAPDDLGGEVAQRLAALPYFQRLNHVGQLGLVPLCRNMDGCHTRLSHCIGTVAWATRFLEAIGKQEELSEPVRLAVLMAAFIHDAKHGPFGHSLDMLRDVFAPNVYIRLDKYLLVLALSQPDSQLRAALEHVLDDLLEPEECRDLIFDHIRYFVDRNAYTHNPEFKTHYYLAQIVDSALDADRMDYVFRDCRHLGRSTSPDVTEMLELVRGVNALPVPDPDTGNEVTRLCFSKKHKESLVDRFLQVRRDLYLDYYESPEKLIADDMLAHIVYYTIHDVQGVPLGRFGYSRPEETHGFAAQFMMLTDQSLVQFIYEVGGGNQRSRFGLHLLNDLLRGNLFLEIGREDVLVRQAKDLWDEHTCFKAAIAEEEKAQHTINYGADTDSRLVIHPDKSFEILSSTLKSHSHEIALIHFANLFSGGFQDKHCVEKEIWARLLKDNDFKTSVLNYFFELTGADVDDQAELEAVLPDIPLLHITMPTYAATSARDIEEYATEPASAERIAYYSDDTVELLSADLPRSEGLKKPLILLSTTRYFAMREKDRTKILEAWQQCMFEDLTWARLSPDVTLPTGDGRLL